MTNETPNLPSDPEMITDPASVATPSDNPAVGDPKLALDEFSEAIGDDPIAPASPQTANPDRNPAGLEALYDIPVNITVVLGRTQIEVTDLLALGKGDIVELDRKVGEAVDILVNNRMVARGEVVLVDERLGITMTEIIKSSQS